ncbi:MAG: Mov34/MPN/PAD-1 family protein [Opitutae bacterium]|nr:Mov34/MPN/PAD-1 family protein [Opitutae bacterium]
MDWENTMRAGLELPTGRENEILRIEPQALAIVDRFRQVGSSSPEAGGMLLASIEPGLVRVVCATEPAQQDKRGRFSFMPALGPQQRTIDRQFKSGLHYIGEWHPHPEACPRPSSVDLRSMSECFRLSKHQLSGLVMIIIGTERTLEGLWVGLHSASAIRRLNPAAPGEASATHKESLPVLIVRRLNP